MVPFLNLSAQHEPLRKEFLAAIDQVIQQNAFASGPFVKSFEDNFAAFCDVPHAIGVGSGTEAIWLSLLSLGIGPGDEVITVPNTFMATAEAISYCGAKPVFVDIEEQTYNLNPELLADAITSNTKAIVPVHIFGQMANMDPIFSIAAKHDLPVVEDAAQAHGAEYFLKKAGSMGIAGCFSFYPGKNLGAFGEAGAIVTANEELRHKILSLRDHGQARKYYHDSIGWNSRMDGIQGAVLDIKLRSLNEANEARRSHAQAYGKLLNQVEGLTLPTESDGRKHVYHLYVVRVNNRDQVLDKLKSKGIHCGIHYPVPVHLQKSYHFLGLGPGSFPVAEKCADEFLSLPMFPDLTSAQIELVADELKHCLAEERQHECIA